MLTKVELSNVQIENAADIHPNDRPLWMIGTPMLICLQNDEIRRGFDAYNHIQDMIFHKLSSTSTPSQKVSALKSHVQHNLNTIDLKDEKEESNLGVDFIENTVEEYSTDELGSKLTADDMNRAMQMREEESLNVPPIQENSLPQPDKISPLKD